MDTRTLSFTAISLSFLLIMAGLYLYSYRPHLYQWPRNSAIMLPEATCEPLWAPCRIDLFPTESVSIHLSLTRLPLVSPLYIQVTTDSPSILDFFVIFSEASSHSHLLELNRQHDGNFIAKTILPTPSTGINAIQFSLTFTRGQLFYRLPVKFKAVTP